MKPLTIELEPGKKQTFQSLGWKTPAQGNHRSQFFAVAPHGTSVIVTIEAAKPPYFLPGFDAVFSKEPFPEAVCIEISPCRLLPPPCYESDADFERQQHCHATFEPWKFVYLQIHDEALILKQSDEESLRARLDKWLIAKRAAYEREAAPFREENQRLKHKTLAELNFASEDQRAARISEIREQLAILDSENQIEGVPCKGWLKLTVADVKLGGAGIRDNWLQENWAVQNDYDLNLMARQRRSFRRWLEEYTGTPAIIFDTQTRQRRQGISPPDFGERHDHNPQFLVGCAAVRYLARFASNGNSAVYLAECEVRQELTAAELEEAEKLQRAIQAVSASDTSHFHFSPNHRTLFWNDGKKKEQATLTKTQANAFSALHKAHGHTLARDEWQQEIYGDSPPDDFRPDKLFAYRDGPIVWKRFIRVEGDRYRLVFDQM